MTFGRGKLLPQKYKILQKRRHKLPSDFESTRERLNMSRSPGTLISIAVNHCVTLLCYVLT